MSPKLKKRLKLLVRGGCALLLLVLASWVFAPWFLWVESSVGQADAIVVLGGEPQTRPTRGAEVFKEVTRENQKAEIGKTKTPTHGNTNSESLLSAFSISALPLVIVSGDGDCHDVRRQMEARGVPHAVIVTECESRNTFENAAQSVKLLRERHITNVVLVTSWYHSRRALACFESAAPEIHFASRPTSCPPAGVRHPDSYIVKRVFQEYAKIAYYVIGHGILPW